MGLDYEAPLIAGNSMLQFPWVVMIFNSYNTFLRKVVRYLEVNYRSFVHVAGRCGRRFGLGSWVDTKKSQLSYN